MLNEAIDGESPVEKQIQEVGNNSSDRHAPCDLQKSRKKRLVWNADLKEQLAVLSPERNERRSES